MREINGAKASRQHFLERSADYNLSASWVCDSRLSELIYSLASPGKDAVCLDLAVGTGQVSRAFKGKVGKLVGCDVCPEMAGKALEYLDYLILGKAEKLPFADRVFDACTVRQGLQFMEIEAALSEVHRVLKPGGRIVSAHLTAYGDGDCGTTFGIQKLRNPARKNFFMPGDICRIAGRLFEVARSMEYVTRESVKNWITHGAIPRAAQDEIIGMYENSPEAFRKIHRIEITPEDIYDSMRMEIVYAIKS